MRFAVVALSVGAQSLLESVMGASGEIGHSMTGSSASTSIFELILTERMELKRLWMEAHSWKGDGLGGGER